MKGERDLLELLREKSECAYISDLLSVYQNQRSRFIRILEGFDWNCFSLEEWTEAICYISSEKHIFHSIADAVDFLCQTNHAGMK